jgi:FkbM family methyltransferase
MITRLKNIIKVMDVLISFREVKIQYRDFEMRALKPFFWGEASQKDFDFEIAPYLQSIPDGFDPEAIVDAGGYSGHFSVMSALLYPKSRVYVFEPSLRNRLLIKRMAKLNGVDARISIFPFALWNTSTRLAFRTHGSISSIFGVGSLPENLEFAETVEARTLDQWVEETSLQKLDLIKMDIEGAEVEALQGAVKCLQQYNPLLLVQAYHLRNGVRTYQACAEFLLSLGYSVSESDPGSGNIVAHRAKG